MGAAPTRTSATLSCWSGSSPRASPKGNWHACCQQQTQIWWAAIRVHTAYRVCTQHGPASQAAACPSLLLYCWPSLAWLHQDSTAAWAVQPWQPSGLQQLHAQLCCTPGTLQTVRDRQNRCQGHQTGTSPGCSVCPSEIFQPRSAAACDLLRTHKPTSAAARDLLRTPTNLCCRLTP